MLLFELDNYVSGNVVYNNDLNPKIYDDDGNMRPEVHSALMAVANNFINDIDLPDMVIHDIILTGSSANYNWTKFSDIDLHLISDVDVFADPHMAEKYFRAAKNVWNNSHDVQIRELDVEVYVEDNDEVNESLGRYSVLNDEWISKPVYNKPVFDESAVNRKVRYLMKEIDHVMSSSNPAEIEHIKSKLWNMRKAGLARAGEFSVENLAFKVLRNMGYAQKILNAIRDAEDDEMSVESMKINELNEDDYWGDRDSEETASRRSEERKAAILDLVKNIVDWEDRISWHRDELYYSVPSGRAEREHVMNDPAMKDRMKEDMRYIGKDIIEELRTSFEMDFEISVLGPFSVSLEQTG